MESGICNVLDTKLRRIFLAEFCGGHILLDQSIDRTSKIDFFHCRGRSSICIVIAACTYVSTRLFSATSWLAGRLYLDSSCAVRERLNHAGACLKQTYTTMKALKTALR
jgi:hypothetical protein